MKEWHFFDKVYRRWVVLFIGPLIDFKEEMRANGYKYLDEITDAKGMCLDLSPENNTEGQNCTVIWLREYETATLVHELAHLVMILFEQVLVPISRENTEAFAFYQEFWFNEIQRARRKFPNGRSPKEARK